MTTSDNDRIARPEKAALIAIAIVAHAATGKRGGRLARIGYGFILPAGGASFKSTIETPLVPSTTPS